MNTTRIYPSNRSFMSFVSHTHVINYFLRASMSTVRPATPITRKFSFSRHVSISQHVFLQFLIRKQPLLLRKGIVCPHDFSLINLLRFWIRFNWSLPVWCCISMPLSLDSKFFYIIYLNDDW